jgi:hypothetical protein
MPFEKFALDPLRATSSRGRLEPEITRSIGNARYTAVMGGQHRQRNGGAVAPLVEASVDPLTPIHLRRQGSVEMPAMDRRSLVVGMASLDGGVRSMEEVPLADLEAGLNHDEPPERH